MSPANAASILSSTRLTAACWGIFSICLLQDKRDRSLFGENSLISLFSILRALISRGWAVASLTEIVTLDGGERPVLDKFLEEEAV